MKVVVGLLIFVILPIAFFIFVGVYYKRVRKRMKDDSFESLRKAMSPREFRIVVGVIGFLFLVNVLVLAYNRIEGR